MSFKRRYLQWTNHCAYDSTIEYTIIINRNIYWFLLMLT